MSEEAATAEAKSFDAKVTKIGDELAGPFQQGAAPCFNSAHFSLIKDTSFERLLIN